MLKDNMPDDLSKLLEEDFISQGLLRIAKVSIEDLSDNLELGLYKILYATKLYSTVYAKGRGIQCSIGRNRSVGDLFRIMKYYYPEITFKEMRSLLYSLCEKGLVVTLYCDNINKRVYYAVFIFEDNLEVCSNLKATESRYNNPSNEYFVYGLDYTDEFGSSLNWSEDEVENMINNEIAIKYYEQFAEV